MRLRAIKNRDGKDGGGERGSERRGREARVEEEWGRRLNDRIS